MFDLKRFRKENNLTQKQLAEYLNVTQGFVSQIEKGASQLPERYISKILEDNLYKISDNELKEELNNNINNRVGHLDEDGILVSREAWNIIKDQITTIQSQQSTIQSQQKMIEQLIKKTNNDTAEAV